MEDLVEMTDGFFCLAAERDHLPLGRSGSYWGWFTLNCEDTNDLREKREAVIGELWDKQSRPIKLTLKDILSHNGVK